MISVANRRDKLLTEIVILDTAKMAEGPIAIIELPFRLRAGVHGSWVMAKDLPEDKDLCDMSGVTDELRKEFSRTGPHAEKTNGNGTLNGGS